MLSVLSSLALLSTVSAALYPNLTTSNHTCALDPQYLSCSTNATAGNIDTCCVEQFGGLLVATQFWSIYTGLESAGQMLPAKSWTLHGLWPDFCNGSYTQYCDLSRQYDPVPSPNTTNGLANGTVVPAYTNSTSITSFIQDFGRFDLLEWMNNYWINQGAGNEAFWAHEFSKHATCFSTFDIPCYGPKYVEREDVIDFLDTAIAAYKEVPTYDWLASAGIVPSNTTTYSLSDLESALTNSYGAKPYVGCSGPRYNTTAAGNGTTDGGRTSISEVWYYRHARGRVQNNLYEVVGSTSNSSCATSAGALHYYERSNGSERAV